MPCNDKNLPPDDDPHPHPHPHPHPPPHPQQPGNSRPTRARARKKKPLEVMPPPPPPDARPPEADPPEADPPSTDADPPAPEPNRPDAKPPAPDANPPRANPPETRSGSCDSDARRWCPSHTILTDQQWQQLAADLELPPREVDVIKQFFDGASERGAAYQLGISKLTVHDFAKRIYRRLGVSDRTELILRIWEASMKLTTAPQPQPPPPDQNDDDEDDDDFSGALVPS